MNKKYLIIVALVVVLVGSYCLVKYAKAPAQESGLVKSVTTTIDTSDWLTYRDEKNGYEVKYPKGSRINDESATTIIYLTNYLNIPKSELGDNVNPGINEDAFLSVAVGLTYKGTPEVSSLRDWVKSLYEGAESPNFANVDGGSGKDIMFGNIPAYLLEYPFKGGRDKGIAHELYILHDHKVYELTYATLSDGTLSSSTQENKPSLKDTITPIQEAIINSFKFIENSVASTTIDTSDWLTYQNDLYGYSVKYPKESIVESESVGAGIDFTNYFPRDNGAESQFSNSFIDGAGILTVDAGVVYRESPPNLSLQNWVKSVYDELNNINNTKIDGASGKNIRYLDSNAYLLEYPVTKGSSKIRGVQHEIYIIHSNHVYKLRYTTSSEFEAAKPISEAIVNSVRFTK